MTFGYALEAVREGQKIGRDSWPGPDDYVEMVTCINYTNANGDIVTPLRTQIANSSLIFVGEEGIQLGWTANQADMLADDWNVLF